jgi:hypothetical protein
MLGSLDSCDASGGLMFDLEAEVRAGLEPYLVRVALS